MTDVVISITGLQGSAAGDEEIIELVTDGRYTHGKNGSFISYNETELTGLEGTETSVLVRPAEIVLTRRGLLNSRMVFREGEKNKFLYDTQFGSATLGIDTRRIDASFDENGGEMCIDYVVNMDHVVVGRNKIKLSVKPQRS